MGALREMTVAEKLDGIIREKGIKKKYVAEMMGWSSNRLSDLLHGRKALYCDHLFAVCDVLGITPNDVFSYKPKGRA